MADEAGHLPEKDKGTEFSEVLVAASAPWAFTQEYPLRTKEFCDQAKKRRVPLSEDQLPGLWRRGVLAPFVEEPNTPSHPPWAAPLADPLVLCTSLSDLRVRRGGPGAVGRP